MPRRRLQRLQRRSKLKVKRYDGIHSQLYMMTALWLTMIGAIILGCTPIGVYMLGHGLLWVTGTSLAVIFIAAELEHRRDVQAENDGAQPLERVSMERFIKRQVEVRAIQFTDENKDMVFNELRELQFNISPTGTNIGEQPGLRIPTPEGDMHVSLNDWVIQGTHGELYPCKPDIFNELYDTVD